ncbi:hypothetical protein VB834_04080 [Limnoraphis robusta Tam1]|nr:hypothetical protein [Limnoraphis robusta Tam1]
MQKSAFVGLGVTLNQTYKILSDHNVPAPSEKPLESDTQTTRSQSPKTLSLRKNGYMIIINPVKLPIPAICGCNASSPDRKSP